MIKKLDQRKEVVGRNLINYDLYTVILTFVYETLCSNQDRCRLSIRYLEKRLGGHWTGRERRDEMTDIRRTDSPTQLCKLF